MVNLSGTNQKNNPKSRLILVIDDEEPVREAVKDILEMIHVEVLSAENGTVGIDIYREHKDNIALVLLDLSMPGLDGEATFQGLWEIDQDVRVLLSSGFSETEINSRFANKNLTGFIQKPYTLDALINKVQAFLD
ncbi:MAG: response regulator [Chloroflexi bacterium]|nr:response regulator [Chloroflexota bacterium]